MLSVRAPASRIPPLVPSALIRAMRAGSSGMIDGPFAVRFVKALKPGPAGMIPILTSYAAELVVL